MDSRLETKLDMHRHSVGTSLDNCRDIVGQPLANRLEIVVQSLDRRRISVVALTSEFRRLEAWPRRVSSDADTVLNRLQVCGRAFQRLQVRAQCTERTLR